MMNEEKKTHQLGKQVLHEDDLKIPVEYKGEIFTLRYPNPYMITQIEAEIARRLGGLPRDAYSVEHVNLVMAATYVDNLIIQEESPAWFTSAWTTYDEALIGTLFAGYYRFRDDIQQKIREDRFERNVQGGSG